MRSVRGNGCYVIIGESGSRKSTLLRLLKYYDDYFVTISLFQVAIYVNFRMKLYINRSRSSNRIRHFSVFFCKKLASGTTDIPLWNFEDKIFSGERRRISIARALRCYPKILVIEELTTDLKL